MWLFIFKTNLLQHQIMLFSFLLPLLHIIIPFAYFFWALKEGFISDIDITKRTQRFGIMSLMLIMQLTSLTLIYMYGNTGLLHLALITMVVFVTTFLITLVWKISLHTTINMIGILLVNVLFGWKYTALFLLLPLVMWSRLYLKKHTALQLLAGAALSGGIMIAGFSYFNLI